MDEYVDPASGVGVNILGENGKLLKADLMGATVSVRSGNTSSTSSGMTWTADIVALERTSKAGQPRTVHVVVAGEVGDTRNVDIAADVLEYNDKVGS